MTGGVVDLRIAIVVIVIEVAEIFSGAGMDPAPDSEGQGEETECSDGIHHQLPLLELVRCRSSLPRS